VGEDAAQLVVRHLAEEGAAPAEARQPRHRVGRRAAGRLHAWSHLGVERLGLSLVHQGHGALGDAGRGQKGVVGRRDHVDDGVADGGDVVEVWHG
jgi:hypothetical protein